MKSHRLLDRMVKRRKEGEDPPSHPWAELGGGEEGGSGHETLGHESRLLQIVEDPCPKGSGGKVTVHSKKKEK